MMDWKGLGHGIIDVVYRHCVEGRSEATRTLCPGFDSKRHPNMNAQRYRYAILPISIPHDFQTHFSNRSKLECLSMGLEIRLLYLKYGLVGQGSIPFERQVISI
jgi:hypothetical protein